MKTLKNIFFVTIPVLIIFFILLEILSRLFFPGSDEPKAVYDDEHQIIKFSHENGKSGLWTKGRFSQQQGRWMINNEGWNSPIDYHEAKKDGVKRIAVIGDSYIQALQLNIDRSYPYILGDSLGEKYEVYSFGASGSPLSQYLNVSRYVEKKYSPDIYIFNLVHNDFLESITGLAYNSMYLTIQPGEDSSFNEIQPLKPERSHKKIPGGDLLKKSSFFRYVYNNLNLRDKFKSKQVAKQVEMNVALGDVYANQDAIRDVTKYVLRKIQAELGNKEIIFVMDGPRWNIYDGNVAQSRVTWLNSMVASHSKELNLQFIDLMPLMEKDFNEKGKRFETDYDSHWADYGHQFVADVIYNHLKVSKF